MGLSPALAGIFTGTGLSAELFQETPLDLAALLRAMRMRCTQACCVQSYRCWSGKLPFKLDVARGIFLAARTEQGMASQNKNR